MMKPYGCKKLYASRRYSVISRKTLVGVDTQLRDRKRARREAQDEIAEQLESMEVS